MTACSVKRKNQMKAPSTVEGLANKEKQMDTTVKYPEIEVQLTGQDGNAFAIMGAVSGALRRHGVPKEEIDAYTKESMSGDYDHLLQTAMRWVSVS